MISGETREACSVCIRKITEPTPAAVCHAVAAGAFSFNHPASSGDRLVLWTVDAIGNKSVDSETVAGNQSDPAIANVYEGEATGIADGVSFADTYVDPHLYRHLSHAETQTEGVTNELSVIELNNHLWYGTLRGKAGIKTLTITDGPNRRRRDARGTVLSATPQYRERQRAWKRKFQELQQ